MSNGFVARAISKKHSTMKHPVQIETIKTWIKHIKSGLSFKQ